MAFTVQDFHDLVEILQQQPDWRVELRRLVLSEELLTLPQLVRQLADSQQRVEQRLGRLEQAVVDLADAQRRTEQRVAELYEAQTQTERRLGRIEIDHGNFKGILLEERHWRCLFVFFRWIIRRAEVLQERELEALLAASVADGTLSQEQADDVMLADVVVQGRLNTDHSEVYLVVEVSWGVGISDVERAVRRAELLAQVGVATLPVVSGNGITPEAVDRCREMQVWQLIDGRAIEPAA